MLDIQLLHRDIDAVAARLKDRDYVLDVADFTALETERETIQTRTEELQVRHDSLSKQIGVLKGRGEDASGVMAEVSGIGDELRASAARFDVVQAKLQDLILSIPNLPHESVPAGRDETRNVEARREGMPRTFGFPMKDHVDLDAALGLDFGAGVKLSGARFTTLKGRVACLHRALAQSMLGAHTLEHGYTEAYVPYIVNAASMHGMGQLPKFEEDLFHVSHEMGHSAEERDDERVENFYLTPTTETLLMNLVRDEIMAVDTLPMMFAAHSLCFRSEADSHDKDTRGMIRQHQFDKVGMVQIVQPETSAAALEAVTDRAENILRKLGLPPRTVVLYTDGMGFDSIRAYDIEVWIPAQSTYRGIGSYSNMGDFQARQMQARFRNAQGKPELVYMLNGLGLAVDRTLAALPKNYRNADGLVAMPMALRPYLSDQGVLKPAV